MEIPLTIRSWALTLLLLLPLGKSIAQTPELVTQIGHQAGVTSIAMSQNGKYLASADKDGIIKIWDMATAQNRYTLSGYGPLFFFLDDQYLIANVHPERKKSRKDFRYFRIPDFVPQKKIPREELKGQEAIQHYRIVRKRRKIKLKPTIPGLKKIVLKESGGRMMNIAVSPDGRYIAAGIKNGDLFIYNRAINSRLKRIKPKAMYAREFSFRCPFRNTEFQFMQFSETGELLFFGSQERISVAEIEAGEVTQVLNLQPHWTEQLGAVSNSKDRHQSRMIVRHSQNYSPISSRSPIELGKASKLPYMTQSELPGAMGLYRYASQAEIRRSLKTKVPYWGTEKWDPKDFQYGTVLTTELFSEQCPCNFYKPANTINVREDVFATWNTTADSIEEAKGHDRARLYLYPLRVPKPPQMASTEKFSKDHLLTLNPIQSSAGQEKPFYIRENPASNILPYFYYYNAMDSKGNILPDSLVEIAYTRRDTTLIKFFEQSTNVGWQLKRLRKQIALIDNILSFQDQSDTLEVTALPIGEHANRLEASRKREVGSLIKKLKKPEVDFKISSNNRYLALTIENKSLSIFDLFSAKLIHEHSFPNKTISDVAIAPDNRFLMLADNLGTITHYTLPSMKTVQVFGPSTFPVNRIMINKDGSGMMTGEFSRAEGGGNFWDLKSGEKIGYVGANEYQKCQAGYDATGNFLLIEGYLKHQQQQMTLVTDMDNRRKVEIQPHQGLHRKAYALENGKDFLVVGGAHNMGLIDRYSVSEGKLLARDTSSVPHLITCLSPTSFTNRVLLAGHTGILYDYDASKMQIKDSIQLSEDWILTLESDSTRNSVVSGGLDRILRRVDLQMFKINLISDSFPSPIKLARYSPDGSQLAVVDVAENVFLVDATNFRKKAILPWRDEHIQEISWSRDNNYLITHRTSKGLNHKGTGVKASRLWNLKTNREDTRFSPSDELGLPLLMALAPTTPRILVGGNGRRLTCFDLNTGDSLFQAGYLSALTGTLQFDPSGKSFYTASHEVQVHWLGFSSKVTNQNSRIITWNALTGKVVAVANPTIGIAGIAEVGKKASKTFLRNRIKGVSQLLSLLFMAESSAVVYSQCPKYKTYQALPLIANIEVAPNKNMVSLHHWDNSFSVLDFSTQKSNTIKIPQDDYYHGFKIAGGRLYEYYPQTYQLPRAVKADSVAEPSSEDQLTGKKRLFGEGSKGKSTRTIPTEKRFQLGRPFGLIQSHHLYDSGKSSLWDQIQAGSHAGKQQMKKRSLKKGKTLATRSLSSQSIASSHEYQFEELEKLLPYNRTFKLVKKSWGTPFRKLKPIFEHQHHGTLNYSFGASDTLALTAGGDSKTILWDTRNASPTLQIASTYNNAGHIMFDSLQNYMATHKAASLIGFAFGPKMYPFEVFDFYLNRPDRIAAQMPSVDSSTVILYRSAHTRRRERLGIMKKDTELKFEVPVIEINGPPSFSVSEADSIEVRIHTEDTSGVPLIRLEGWVNDVPLFGLDGIDLSRENRTVFDTLISIPLSNGKNTIQFSSINKNLIKSWKETISIDYIGPEHSPRLYVVSLGVSAYTQELNSLAFPASDARYFAQYLQECAPGKKYYSGVESLVLTDMQVDAKALQTVQTFLAQANPDDRVLFYLSGHGFNDPLDQQYYFHTNSFHPDGKRILFSFNQLDSLLAGTPSRNKLLILNTCGSGDVDSQNSFRFGEDFLAMQDLFLDLRRSSGSTVLAASSGYQYVREFASVESSIGPMVKFITQMLDGAQGEMRVGKFCNYIQYLFDERSSELQSKPEVRFANLRNNFRLF